MQSRSINQTRHHVITYTGRYRYLFLVSMRKSRSIRNNKSYTFIGIVNQKPVNVVFDDPHHCLEYFNIKEQKLSNFDFLDIHRHLKQK